MDRKRQSKPAAADQQFRKEFRQSFARIHILHHAVQEPVVGLWMIEELSRHGYRISPGTLYPMLHEMERRGHLRSAAKKEGRRSWKEYRATAAGKRALSAAKEALQELVSELSESHAR